VTRTEAHAIIASMIERRRERAELERVAAKAQRDYGWGLQSASRRAAAYEMADQHEAAASRLDRTVAALNLILEDDNGGRVCSACGIEIGDDEEPRSGADRGADGVPVGREGREGREG